MKFFYRPGACACAPVLVILLFLGILSSSGVSQVYLNDQYKTTYAITGAKIVIGNGQTIENGSVLLKDGLISAVGKSISIPSDAKVIDGTGMTVYPGFIDMHTNLGFGSRQAGGRRMQGAAPAQSPQSQQQQQEQEPEPKIREFNPNLRPDQIAFNLIDMNDENIKAAREAGITAAVTVPSRSVFPGRASLIVTHGDDPLQSVVKDKLFQVIQYSNQRAGYPGTLFAVVSFQQQSLLDAKYYMQRETDFAKNPIGALNSLKNRLVYDPTLRELFPVVSGTDPVLIPVLKENDVKRAVELAHFEGEFNLNYMLSGVTEGYRIVDLLKKENVPVIVSLNFPEPARTTGYAFNLPIKQYKAPPPPGEKPKREGEEEEKDEIAEMVRQQIHANAATLHNARIKTVLSAGGNYNDFLKNLRLAVNAGLPADVALAKITTEPAAMLGVAQIMGTVEIGKLGNIVITDGDLFTDESKVKMVFVDGIQYVIEEKREQNRGSGVGRDF